MKWTREEVIDLIKENLGETINQQDLFDLAEPTLILDGKSVPVHISINAMNLFLSPKGLGDHYSRPGEGSPILLTLKEDETLEVVIWGDVNQEDPTHTIDLSGAEEERRTDD